MSGSVGYLLPHMPLVRIFPSPHPRVPVLVLLPHPLLLRVSEPSQLGQPPWSLGVLAHLVCSSDLWLPEGLPRALGCHLPLS